MGEFICRIFAWPLVKFYEATGSYGLAIVVFALMVNLIMTPFMAKSKKSMMRSSRLQPKIQELQRRHEGNQQKLNAEMQKLYQEEGINPMSGCLWSLIPFPILIALYSVIRRPITRMMFCADSVVDALKEFMTAQGWYVAGSGRADAYAEITLSNLAHQHWSEVTSSLAGKIDGLMNIDFRFLGINLGEQPQWNFFTKTDWSDPSVWGPALGLFLIPFISAALSWASMKISSAATPSTGDAQSQATMKSMNLMMPLMSIWICFVMPAAMGIYWIANSVFGMIRDYILTKIYKKKLDEEDAVRAAERAEREKEMAEKRAEYERLKAEGKTPVNANTSKKKLQASEKQRLDERKAALEKADRAARRERLGIKEAEKPASQVGNRRYARGRAYVPDRFEHPETAEAETLAAAAESEDAPAIDESVVELSGESFEAPASDAADGSDGEVGDTGDACADAGESEE
ncbi:MAG: membrane protein insertase YidC [Eubacteriales bacterium]|nr:membrane protein insertase YidC [Eubacteriales bacterium]